MTVVDASIVVRLLQNQRGDERLRQRFRRERFLHAPHLIDAEVASAIRGLLLTAKPEIKISPGRAGEMLDDFADLRLLLHPMQPYQRRALALRHNFTVYDGMYVALAEALRLPLLTDGSKYQTGPVHTAVIETYRPADDQG